MKKKKRKTADNFGFLYLQNDWLDCHSRGSLDDGVFMEFLFRWAFLLFFCFFLRLLFLLILTNNKRPKKQNPELDWKNAF